MKNLNVKLQLTPAEKIAQLRAQLAAAEKEARAEADVEKQEQDARRQKVVAGVKKFIKGLLADLAAANVARILVAVDGETVEVEVHGAGRPRSTVTLPETGVTRTYKGVEYLLRAVDGGFSVSGIDGAHKSLTAAAMAVNGGKNVNGRNWWRVG